MPRLQAKVYVVVSLRFMILLPHLPPPDFISRHHQRIEEKYYEKNSNFGSLENSFKVTNMNLDFLSMFWIAWKKF
jgi:hypothetical protein